MGQNGSLLFPWVKHSICFLYPLATLLFLATAPHPWYIPSLYLLFLILVILYDLLAGAILPLSFKKSSNRIFSIQLFLLTIIQLFNAFLIIRLPSVSGLMSWDVILGIIPLGVNAGMTSAVLSHELVHSRSKFLHFLARPILISYLYDHMYSEHIPGHHNLYATPKDPATARFNETFLNYFFRTSWGQFKLAWDLEKTRVGKKSKSFAAIQLLQNKVFQGVVIELVLMISILLFFNFGSLIFFLTYAVIAHVNNQAGTYFEHYALDRKTSRLKTQNAWDSTSRYSVYALLGLACHSDHHCHPSRSYQNLKIQKESPRLPYGYIVSSLLVILWNNRYRKLANAELFRLKLGPYSQAIT